MYSLLKTLIALVFVAATTLAPRAEASVTASAVPTSVTLYNSASYGWACLIEHSGATYYVDDVYNNYGPTCTNAAIAKGAGKAITLYYNLSSDGITRVAYGMYTSNTASYVDYIYTDDATSTTSGDNCKAYLNGSSGSAWVYVDDGQPEEIATCAALYAAQLWNRGWQYSKSSTSELRYFTLK